MVFESIVTDVLNRFLGDYIENLNSNQLKLGIWGGDVVLNNLVLKQSALSELDLPIQTVYGRLDKLVLKIPWKNLYGASVEASIEGLYVLVKPNNQVKYSAEKEEKRNFDVKQHKLNQIENTKKQQKETKKTDDTFVEKLVTQIIKNVQLSITNIHVRYEEDKEEPDVPYAMGITLSNLTVQTTDEDWVATVVQEMVTKIYKVVSLEGLSVYWNCNPEMFCNLPKEDIAPAFLRDIATKDSKPEHYKYMLGPINSEARLKLNPKPDKDEVPFSFPKALAELIIPKLAIGITKCQYQDIVMLVDSMNYQSRGVPYRKYRPDVPCKGNARDWWKFAYTCVLETQVRRKRRDWNWAHMLEHRETCRTYGECYKNKLLAKKPAADLLENLLGMEKKMDIFNIVLIREQIELEVERLDKIREQRQPKGWFSDWWRSSPNVSDTDLSSIDILKQFQNAMTPSEKEKLFKAIDYQENTAQVSYPDEYADTVVNFHMNNFEICILDDIQNMGTVILSKLQNVKCKVERRPVRSGIKVALCIEKLNVFGVEQDDEIPNIISTKVDSNECNLLNLVFELNPLDTRFAQRLHITSNPLKIIYDAVTIQNIVEVFKVEQSTLDDIHHMAAMRVSDVRDMSAAGLQHVIDRHAKLDLSINISAPYVLIPFGGRYTGIENQIVLNLGKLSICSIHSDAAAPTVKELNVEGVDREQIMDTLIAQSYDHFRLELTNIQLLISQGDENWGKVFDENVSSPMHLLNPLNVHVDIMACFITDDPKLPLIKIDGELPILHINATDARLLLLFSLLNSLPLNKKTEMDTMSVRTTSSTSLFSRILEPERDLPVLPVKRVSKSVVEMIKLELSFVLKDLQIKLSHQELLSSPINDILKINLKSISSKVVIKTFNTSVDVTLEDFLIQQFLKASYVNIVSTVAEENENYLFNINFLMADKRGPHFHELYQNCESLMKVRFSSMKILLHQESLKELMQQGIEFNNQVQDLMNDDKHRRFRMQRSISISSSHKFRSKMQEKVKLSAKNKHIIIFMLQAKFNKLTVVFESKYSQLSSITVEGINSSIMLKVDYTKIELNLDNIVVNDLNVHTIHKKILTIVEGEKAIIIAMTLNNESNRIASEDIKIKAKFGCIRFTFINSYITNMMDFFNQFQLAREAIMAASEQVAKSAKENMTNIYEKAMKIRLDIGMNAPEIIIPESSKSYRGLLIDLGYIMISNNFKELKVVNENGNNAVVDELFLKLDNLNLGRIIMEDDSKIAERVTMLQPVSFTLSVQRNLSAWYKAIPSINIDGNLDTVQLLVSEADYGTIMKIVNGNLTESTIDSHMQLEMVMNIDNASNSEISNDSENIKVDVVQESEQSNTDDDTDSEHNLTTMLRWNFFMKSFKINLFTSLEDESKETTEIGLAELALEGLAIRGRMLSNNSISNALLLVDCLLIDKRPGREDKINILFGRAAEDDAGVEKLGSATRNMIDVTFQQKKRDIFIDVRIYSFTFILSVEYMLKLNAFFSSAIDKNSNVKEIKTVQAAAPVKPVQVEDNNKMLTVALKLEKPNIILVEHMDTINSKALILNFEGVVKLRLFFDQVSISGFINDFQMYTCIFDPNLREKTRNDVLQPITITVAGSTPEGKGMHIEVIVTDIRICVSIYTIELLNNIMLSLSASTAGDDGKAVKKIDYSNMWNMNVTNEEDFWFLKNYDVHEALDFNFPTMKNQTTRGKQEMCILTMPSIICTFEAGVGNKTFPMIILESRFQGKVTNWSSQLTIEASLTLVMAYYNSLLALWEPLIEPVMMMDESTGLREHKPWEIRLEVAMNDAEEQSMISENEIESNAMQPAMTIDISSSNNLELTVTKTLLDVFSDLSKMLAKAINKDPMFVDQIEAQFKIVNATGLEIILLIEQSSLVLLGEPNADKAHLKNGAEVYLDYLDDEIIHLKNVTELLLPNTDNVSDERYLHVLVPQMSDMQLMLPIMKADTRYFPLKHRGINWGLISSVTVENGVTIITLSSILRIHNTFNIPVDTYYMRDSGNELEFISTIQPRCIMHVPMKAVYSPTSELFFSVNNYSVTRTPYVWKDLQLNVAVNKNLTCSSKIAADDFFVIRAIGEMSQVFSECTSKYTMASTVYNIYLRPAVILKNCLPINIVLISQHIQNEIRLSPGDSIEIPNVEPGKSYVVIRLPDYLEKEWSCRSDIAANPPQFSVWTFNSYDSVLKVSLDLGMHLLNQAGTFIMSLYCPFWMMNKTGLVLSYRDSDENLNIIHHPPFFKGPVLFSFNAKNFFGKKKACVRVDQGEWSDKFSIDVAGSSGVVVCTSNEKIYQIGVSNKLTYNGLTKQITFTPYYVIINNTSVQLECQELERPADPWITIDAKACCALWPGSEKDDKLIKLRMSDSHEMTAPFLFTESHTTLLKLKNKYGGINVDIQLTEGAIYINLALYDTGMAPALIINNTRYTMNLWEKESVNIKNLPADSNMYYTWDNPSAQRILVWEGGYKEELEDDLRKDNFGEYAITVSERVYWVSFLDGMQRVLLFTSDMSVAESAQASKEIEIIDREITVSIYGVGLSIVNNIKRQEILYIGIASTGIVWEASKFNSKRFKQVSTKDNMALEKAYQVSVLEESTSTRVNKVIDQMEVNFADNIMIKPHKRRIRRRFQTGLWLQMKTSQHQMQLHAKINRLQVDNQLYDCTFPVLLAPVPPPKSISIAINAHKPFAEVSVVQLLIKNSQIRQFKYFKVLIQEFHVKVDLGFINSLMEIIDTTLKNEQEEKDKFLADKNVADQPLYQLVCSHSIQEQKSFYDLLHFSPLKIHVSFSMVSGNDTGISNMPVFLSVLLQGIGVTLTDLQDVIFKLAFFQREYSFLTQRQLISEATTHYLGQTVKQFYVLVLGLDVLGNPYGLVLGLTKGVEDLFYEPFQGAIQGPGEFAEGLMLGVASLFGHTVGGAAGAVSRITGAMGKGVAALTFDKDYQRKRRDQITKKPATIQEGMARGGKGLVMGVFDGVTGVFTKPITGAKEQGVGGFFKGLGKGAVGLVTRPTAGVMDFASTSFETVKRVTDFGHEEVTRLRPPRFVESNCYVQPYNEILAEGNKLLLELEKGKYYSTDTYSCHFDIIAKKEILLLSNKRMAYIKHNDLFGGWQVDWSFTWQEIDKAPTVVPKGVQILCETKKKKGVFNSGDGGKIILIQQADVSKKIVAKITQHMQ